MHIENTYNNFFIDENKSDSHSEMHNPFTPRNGKAYDFVEIAGGVDKDGKSRKVYCNEWEKNPKLRTGNGGTWWRNGSSLVKMFKIRLEMGGNGNKIQYITLMGWNNDSHFTNKIPKYVRKHYKNKATIDHGSISGNSEIDHKNGRKEHSEDNLGVNDFQKISKTGNVAKREHCKRCKSTGERFDARTLGYTVPVIKGTLTHNNVTDNGENDGCVGCYWYDIYQFNQTISTRFSENNIF